MSDRFEHQPYQVCDHAFERGYFDRVIGYPSHVSNEPRLHRRDYRDGWRIAERELKSEPKG